MTVSPKTCPLDRLNIDSRFVSELPGDPVIGIYPRQVYQACYSKVMPRAVSQPKLLAYSNDMAGMLGLSEEQCQSEVFARVMVGSELLPGMQPYSMCYGGHQFGQWAGQLGDGRAINLGEVVNQSGQRWHLQLKGAGLTPYSRRADGLAVLRSSIREFLCSEAMHHLGVATTRALSVVLTGETVLRDMFYDGNPQWESGAVVCRVAPSFLRFGNFEIFAARNDVDTLRQLVDYSLRNEFPQLGPPSVESYLRWFEAICTATAKMIVDWQRLGFVHGVMNTDNMSILGLTIDYGPYGWLENYDPNWTPNTTDAGGRRYRFGNQPMIAYWNLAQLANAIYPLIGEATPLEHCLDRYTEVFEAGWRGAMMRKLGLSTFNAVSDERLIADLFKLLQASEADMTLFFRGLADCDSRQRFAELLQATSYRPLDAAIESTAFDWFERFDARIQEEALPVVQRQAAMNRVNPKFVLRNYLAQQAIDRAELGDFAEVWALLDLLRQPYDDQPGRERFAEKRPDWARHRPGCSMLSCSS